LAISTWSQKAALDEGEFRRHRGQRRAGQRDLVEIVFQAHPVQDADAVIHQPVVDAGQRQRRDVGGLRQARKRRHCGRAERQRAQAPA
jgi:hypothetical protein